MLSFFRLNCFSFNFIEFRSIDQGQLELPALHGIALQECKSRKGLRISWNQRSEDWVWWITGMKDCGLLTKSVDQKVVIEQLESLSNVWCFVFAELKMEKICLKCFYKLIFGSCCTPWKNIDTSSNLGPCPFPRDFLFENHKTFSIL